jgi:predicted RND superfamily exporter protein
MKRIWLNILVQRPWLVLLLGLVLIAGASFGGKNLYFRGDYKVFFEEANPQRIAFEEMQAIFNKNETANIIVAPDSGDVFNQRTLTLIKEMTDEAWQTPLSTRVDSIANFQHTWAEEDDLIVEDLILELDLINQEVIEKARRVGLSEPNLVNRMVSDKGHVAVIAVTVNLPDDNKVEPGQMTRDQGVEAVAQYTVELAETFKQRYPDHNFYHTGMVFMNNAFATESKNDFSTLVPIMFLGIILVLWILLRSFNATFATLIVIVTSIAATMGLAGWMGFFLSTATVNVPTLVMTLAVADCVHVVSSMLFGLREGKSKSEAIVQSMELNLMPILITSVTTSVGFLTLNFANVPVLADLGNLTAIGVIIAFILSVTLLPALLIILPIKVAENKERKNDWIERLGEWVITNHRRILPFTLVFVVGAIAASFLNQVNDVATAYFDDSTYFRQSTNFQQDNISGMATIDFALYTSKESGLNDPQVINTIGRFSDWLRVQNEVDHVATISDTFLRLNKNMHGDDQAYYVLPKEQNLAAQYLLLYEMSLPYGLDLNNQINIDKSATRITVTLHNLGSKEFTEFEQRARDWMTDAAPNILLTAGSPTLMFAHIGEMNMQSMLRGTVVALLLISGLLVFALRSCSMGAISLIPNLMPAAIGFGIWGLYSGEINLGLSIVLSMAMGIIVDDTVHFLSKYRHARVNGQNAEDAVRYAFASVGRALWITTLVLSIGFAVLAMSSFALNSDMGLLTLIIIVVALVVDFIFLPAFLIVFDSKDSTEENKDGSGEKIQVA